MALPAPDLDSARVLTVCLSAECYTSLLLLALKLDTYKVSLTVHACLVKLQSL